MIASSPHRSAASRTAGATALLGIAALLVGCNQRGDVGPVIVSAIGPAPTVVDPVRVVPSAPSRLLLDSIAQGLVRFDANGQVVPGLAERWTVIDDGMSYIFRLREAEWSDGSKVTATQVVALLRRQLAPSSANHLRPFLTAIDEIVEMTPQVIEVRLKHPRPDLLKLFAQPEMALLETRALGGTGPFRLKIQGKAGVLLRPAFDPIRAASDDVQEPGPEESVQLIGERAARAIVRFTERQSDLVSGGTFVDWPLLAFANIAPANLRIDPATGLFGLAIVNRDGFLANQENRTAITQVIDREALVAAFAPNWTPYLQILPEQLDSAATPTMPAWSTLSPSDRRMGARSRVMRWRETHAGPLTLRIALPRGPGATILFGFVAAAFRSIGIESQRVGLKDGADLRLIDAVAPYDSARWYLATACQLCSADVEEKLEAARLAPDLTSRANTIAAANAALEQDAAFIPIARPLRWSIVSLRLRRWQGNQRAWHPLNELRDDTR